eukprot:gene18647-11186_t
MTIDNGKAGKKKYQTGFRISGNATSHYAEAVALEAMLYIGWRISTTTADAAIKIVSDSKTNVDAVMDMVTQRRTMATGNTPTRTHRMAELLRRTPNGKLEWIRGHQKKDGTDEVDVNIRADMQATAARSEDSWDPLQWDGCRPRRFQKHAVLVGTNIEAERRATRQLTELMYKQLHKDLKTHKGLPAAAAITRRENYAMLQ